jgi:hypothetical protein
MRKMEYYFQADKAESRSAGCGQPRARALALDQNPSIQRLGIDGFAANVSSAD